MYIFKCEICVYRRWLSVHRTRGFIFYFLYNLYQKKYNKHKVCFFLIKCSGLGDQREEPTTNEDTSAFIKNNAQVFRQTHNITKMFSLIVDLKINGLFFENLFLQLVNFLLLLLLLLMQNLSQLIVDLRYLKSFSIFYSKSYNLIKLKMYYSKM